MMIFIRRDLNLDRDPALEHDLDRGIHLWRPTSMTITRLMVEIK